MSTATPISDMVGRRYGKLTVLERAHNHNNRWHWLCQCDCGNTTTAPKNRLGGGGKMSCGCLKGEWQIKHGMTGTKEYNAWHRMRERCHDKNNRTYKWYGGRGIFVSDEWRNSFETFFSDMGPAPSKKHQLDRTNNNRGYSKDNCRWVTKKQNACNTRTSKIWAVKGKVFYSSADAARHFGVAQITIQRWCDGGGRHIKKLNCNSFERYLP